jgi:hypothetical protein
MTRLSILAATCLAIVLPDMASAAITQTFASRGAFVAAVGHVTGYPTGLAGQPPVFAASIVTGPVTLSALDDVLAGDGGDIVSTALDSDVLILDFAQPVFAVGLFGGIGDADFAFFDGETAIDVVGSGTTSFANTGTAQYFGLVSDTAFSQLRLSVQSFDGGTSSVAFVGLKRSIDLVGGVPEPSTWGLMMLGFGALGLIARRRRTVSMRAQTA